VWPYGKRKGGIKRRGKKAGRGRKGKGGPDAGSQAAVSGNPGKDPAPPAGRGYGEYKGCVFV